MPILSAVEQDRFEQPPKHSTALPDIMALSEDGLCAELGPNPT